MKTLYKNLRDMQDLNSQLLGSQLTSSVIPAASDANS